MAKKKLDDQIQDDETENQEETVSQPTDDLEGLIKMHKDGQHIHAHPAVVDHHKSNGWKIT